jgi:hypothetical protein
MTQMLADAAAREQMRCAARHLAASMFDSAGRHDRAAAVQRGEGTFLDVVMEAVAELDASKRLADMEAIRIVAESRRRPPS